MKQTEKQSALDRLMSAHAQGLNLLEKAKVQKGPMRVCMGRICSILKDIFGSSSLIFKAYSDRIARVPKDGMTREQFSAEMQELSGLISHLERMGGASYLNPSSFRSAPPAGKKVFIIHGHDELNALRLKEILQDHFGLEPAVIFAKAGMSRPLIDKYEDYAESSCFALALCTPDDEVTNHTEQYSQARPNVIFEIGWFVGRLGRERVLLLLKEGTRIHSDLDGVSRVQFRESVKERVVEIHRELQAAGLA